MESVCEILKTSPRSQKLEHTQINGTCLTIFYLVLTFFDYVTGTFALMTNKIKIWARKRLER